jgi:hypothetical protein
MERLARIWGAALISSGPATKSSAASRWGHAMASVIIGVSFLGGAALGVRWNVFVLIPVLFVVTIVAAITGVRFDYQVRSVVLLVMLAATAVQIGYFVAVMFCPKWNSPPGFEDGQEPVANMPSQLNSSGSARPSLARRNAVANFEVANVESMATVAAKR